MEGGESGNLPLILVFLFVCNPEPALNFKQPSPYDEVHRVQCDNVNPNVDE